MWRLSWKTLRHHVAGAVGIFAVVALATALLTAVGVLGESGLRGGVAPHRFAHADVIVSAALPSGPLSGMSAVSPAPVSRELVDQIAAVEGATDLVTEARVALLDGDGRPVTAHDGALTVRSAVPLEGRMAEQAREVTVESGTGYRIGDEITLSRGAVPSAYTIVGVLDQEAPTGRAGNVYLADAEIQRLWPAAADRTGVIAVFAADGVSATQLADRIEDQVGGVDAAMGGARGKIEHPDAGQASAMLIMLVASFSGIALIVVGLVVTSASSLSVRQRHRQIALLRALGATPKQIRATVTREVLLVGALGGVVGAVPGLLTAPALRGFLVGVGFLPADFELALSPLPAVIAIAGVLLVCLIAARAAARKPSRTAPVEALREAEIEQPTVGTARRISALVCLVLGAFTLAGQFFLPGTAGSAIAVSGTLLFVVALALSGPPIVHWLVTRAGRLPGVRRGATIPLALANSRGFSHRLTAAIIPLTLALVLGVVQLTGNTVIAEAGAHELRDGIGGNTVVTSGAGIAPEVVEKLKEVAGAGTDAADITGAGAAVTMQAGSIYLSSQEEEMPWLTDLMWEPVGLMAIDPNMSTELLDPAVKSGSLADLARPGTIAISTDTQLDQELLQPGDHVPTKFADGTTQELEVVAVYDRSLGFGETIVSEETWAPHTADDLVDIVVLQSDAEVIEVAGTSGLTVQAAAEYADAAVGAQEPVQRVSEALLFALVAFVALAALNTLTMATLARRSEFRFYRLLGAGHRQVVRVALAEAGFVAALAVGLGAAITVPAAVLVSAVSLGSLPPAAVGITFLVLAGVVAVVALIGISIPAAAAAQGEHLVTSER